MTLPPKNDREPGRRTYGNGKAEITVGQLRDRIADLPDHMPVLVSGYEGGFTAPLVKTTHLDYSGPDTEVPWVFGEWADESAYREPSSSAIECLVLAR